MSSSFWTSIPFWGNISDRDDQISRCMDMSELCKGIEIELDRIIALQINIQNGQMSTPKNDKQDGRPGLHELCENLALRLKRVKMVLYEDTAPASEHTPVVESLKASIISNPSLIPKLIRYLPADFMPFESRKDIAAIFNNLIIRGSSDSNDPSKAFADFVFNYYDEIMQSIIDNHGSDPDVALLSGSMLRASLRHRHLYERLLSTDGAQPTSAERYVYPLLDHFVNLQNFDVASDALASVRDIFITDRNVASEYLERDYDNVISKFNTNLQSTNYITRRLSLKFLGEILLDRANFNVMMRYISSRENLKIIMLLLSDPSPNIQFEAFHVFKIFVANPNKAAEITKILSQNKVKLVAYLEKFHGEKESSDDQFRDEKILIVTTLNALE